MVDVGWVGTGVMGGSICKHLIKDEDINLFVHNRTKSKARNLLESGATWCESIADILR